MKKIFLIFLAVFLFSCGGKDPADKNPTGANDPNPDSKENELAKTEPATEKILPNVPEAGDYSGYEFVILANGTEYNSYWYSKDIYVEDENGDAINDAVYYRNRAIEERYNISIKGALKGNLYNEAKKSITSGDNTYDMFTIPLQGATAQLAQDGLLIDLKKTPYVDLEKPWWDQRANTQLSIGHKLMFTISDLLIMDKDSILMFYFNKDMVKELALEDPYQLVREGKWTTDKMWSMAKVATRDIDGDGKMTDRDQYGFISQTHTIHGNIVGTGQMLITKDENDLPAINISNPMILASYEKWIEIFNDRENVFVASDWQKNHADIWQYMLEMTAEARALFQFTHMDRVTTLRSYDCNFGILPNTKHDGSQAEYHNAVNGWCSTSISIPVTSDYDRTGLILEALTAESYYTLRPAYYEISLKTKFLRDDESEEMLDLILKSRCYDLGNFYNWGGIFDNLNTLAAAKKTDFVSGYEKVLPKIESAMQKAIDNFLEND